jgi:glutamyl-tRNA synthetase
VNAGPVEDPAATIAPTVDRARPPVGRLAPSPSGALHLGHARSFLAAWWSVRSRGGRVLLRLEDLDGQRCSAEHAERARLDLRWLGLDWDGETVQSADLGPYTAAVDALLARGAAYPCVCSRRAIESQLSAPHGADSERPYPGTCRGRYASLAAAEAESGLPAGVRLRVPPGRFTLLDDLRGPHSAEPGAETGDFLLLRRDGAIAYQLAVVVDDGRQGVTEVVRGDDLLPSAARQALLQRALGLPHPVWRHLPLVVDEQGRRLSKRDGDLSLSSLREAGVDARRVVGWAAASLGQGSAGDELRSAAEYGERFTWSRVPTRPVAFDPRLIERWRTP